MPEARARGAISGMRAAALLLLDSCSPFPDNGLQFILAYNRISKRLSDYNETIANVY
jgi:hypothetical protein